MYISTKAYDETASEIIKISQNLWNDLYILLDKFDKSIMTLFLLRLHDLLMNNSAPMVWIMWKSDTEFNYIITCEIMELLDGYFDIQEGSGYQNEDVRKYWWIRKINENE